MYLEHLNECNHAVSEHGKCGRWGSEDGMWMGCVNSVPSLFWSKTFPGNERKSNYLRMPFSQSEEQLLDPPSPNSWRGLLIRLGSTFITGVTLGLWLRVCLFFLRVYLEIEAKLLLFYYRYLDSVCMLTVSKIPKILVQENIQALAGLAQWIEHPASN